MQAKWMNTNAAAAAQMLEITDKMILEMSNGEVTHPHYDDEEDNVNGSLSDPDIFGVYRDDCAAMGHISLPSPIINIQYLSGTRPILPRLLHISRLEIRKIVYSGHYIIIEPGTSGMPYKHLLSINEYMEGD